MTYQLFFFCKGTEEDSGASAMDRVLDALSKNGPPLLAEYLGPPTPQSDFWVGPEIEAIQGFRLVTGNEREKPTTDYLSLEMHVGERFIAGDVIAADPNDDHNVRGSDLMAIVTLNGDRPDWPLVDRIWTVLENL
ncbi:hypothetical protein BZB76_5752 [Actinomadura pelletieri DSM 43383]|uniref:Uncharacterized protein n=1 Tax=Actinomadura pelletieri DSM 43383 TaxID=1120940 RepID=A0A495QHK7_9ACTN|nr:hypothetical protein [Actinomadura pelletieri]RKS71263.1 hypothetical protein BZB76_5752 [Actinomadura pelletieri DSM 43383]